MTDEVAKVGVGIVGDDRTADAFKSVEKHAKQTQKRVGEINRKAINDNQRQTASSAKSIIGSMARVEKATASAFGGRSVLSAMGGRIGALTDAASALGEGLAGASVAGSGLAAVAGGAAVAIGAVAAAAAAAAYATFRMGENWAKGAAQLSRAAESIGVSTKTLTEFRAAAQASGVDEGTAVGTMASLSQTLNDARYGRNVQATEVMRRLGIRMKLNKDGTADVDGMMESVADAITRQNSSGRRTAARALGISDAALPAFTRGGKALRDDMNEASKRGVAFNGSVGQKARDADRKRVEYEQNIEASKNNLGKRASDMMSGNVADAVVSATAAWNEVTKGDYKAASKKLGEAGTSLNKAADTLDKKIWHVTDPIMGQLAGMGETARVWGSGSKPVFSSNTAQEAAMAMKDWMSMGWSKEDAAAMVASEMAESSFNPRAAHAGHRGLYQWDAKRQADFRQVMGKDVFSASKKEQRAFANWELHNTEKKAGDALRNAGSVSEKAAAVSRLYERTDNGDFQAAKRANLAESIAQTPTAEPHPVKIEVEVKNGKATSVKTTSGKGAKAAVSHAMVN